MCALLAGVAGCGAAAEKGAIYSADNAKSAERAESAGATASSSSAERAGSSERAFGQPYTFPSGLSITVSRPKSFTPSKTAYPSAPRAIGFEISIKNGTDQPYTLSEISITAAVDGELSPEMIDSTQGYNGIVDLGTQVSVNHKIRLTLAYVAKPNVGSIYLRLRPHRNDATTAVYVGRG